ncbi:hypothetical protein B0J11DRAFT_618311 [Dendryphion nanum]|uniref:Uncharacterized protein n=1 Tax=Dendryphion nanum TaxID=256645 RepID=A0A9P9DAZ3_9PLEO|nr:hypothetical protein B0J11DRAFT_618311 [Dendryphion nanum]
MKLTAQLAALLLVAIPAMVAAAPVAAPGTALVAREVGEIAEIPEIGEIGETVEINDIDDIDFDNFGDEDEINDVDDIDEDEEDEDEEEELEEEFLEPEGEIEDVTRRADPTILFAREGERDCGAPVPTNAADRAIYDGHMRDMAAATTRAHQGESMCKQSEWTAARKNKQTKQRVKDKCIAGYTQCIPARQAANNACKAAGGTISAGHKKSVTFCQNKLKEWQKKSVN